MKTKIYLSFVENAKLLDEVATPEHGWLRDEIFSEQAAIAVSPQPAFFIAHHRGTDRPVGGIDYFAPAYQPLRFGMARERLDDRSHVLGA